MVKKSKFSVNSSKKAGHKGEGISKYKKLYNIFVKSLRGIISHKTGLLVPSAQNQSTVCVDSTENDSLSKNIFFICSFCEGPLTPISVCIVCKRAHNRSCAKCNLVKEVNLHLNCKYLISLRDKIRNQNSEMNQ